MPSTTRPLNAERDALRGTSFETPWGQHAPNALQKMLIAIGRRSFLSRGSFRRWFAHLVASMGSPIDVTFRGARYRIACANNIIEYGLLPRPGYNGGEIDFLLDGLASGGTAVDIGSNIGLYSLPLAGKAGPDGNVISIDANIDMIRALSFNARASAMPAVNPVHAAVGGAEGRVDLNIRNDDVAIVSVEESATGAVEMHPLITILRNAGVSDVDVLKIDIEGFEDAALVPYLDTVGDAMKPDRIVIEHPDPNADYKGCAAAFERHAYRLAGRTRSNSLYIRDSGA